MAQYSSVRASSWDLDGLVTQLNDKAAEGWSVLSVVNTGSDLAAILVRERSEAPAPAAAAEAVPAEVAPDITPVAVGTTTLEPVQEPAGWASAETAAAGAAAGVGAAAAATVAEPVAAATSAATTAAESAAESAAATASSYGTRGADTVTAGAGAAATQAAQAAPATPPVQQVPTTPAGWYPDPSGRYELRYWDGSAWTEHVSRQGQQFTDPPVA